MSGIALEPVVDSDEHYEACRAWLEDVAVTRWLTSSLRFARYLRLMHQALVGDRRSRLYFLQEDGERVGLAALKDLDRVDRRAEVWYLVGSPDRRGRGVATRAVGELVRVAREELGLWTLYAVVAAPNAASIRVLQNCGFMSAGCFRAAFSLDGRWVDLLAYDRLLQKEPAEEGQ